MIVADASLVIALLDSKDGHHERAAEIVLDHPDLLIHPVNLAEVLVGPARAGAPAEVYQALESVGLRVDVPDTDQPVRVAELRAQSRLKLPDCYALDAAETHRAVLATFDAGLASRARARRVVVVDR